MRWWPWGEEPEAEPEVDLADEAPAEPVDPNPRRRVPLCLCDRRPMGSGDHSLTLEAEAEAGRCHVVTAICASYNLRGHSALLTLLQDTETIGTWYCHTERDLMFPEPVRLKAGAGLSVTLAKGAKNVPDLAGALTVYGFTEDAEE